MIFTLQTNKKTEMIDITPTIARAISSEGITDGFCFVFVPHTTAAVTINENADPDVPEDLRTILEKIVPWEDGYRHLEGNSAAHMKTTLVGSSEVIAVEKGKPVLGTWQSIFLCEFDGPRNRKVVVKFS